MDTVPAQYNTFAEIVGSPRHKGNHVLTVLTFFAFLYVVVYLSGNNG